MRGRLTGILVGRRRWICNAYTEVWRVLAHEQSWLMVKCGAVAGRVISNPFGRGMKAHVGLGSSTLPFIRVV